MYFLIINVLFFIIAICVAVFLLKVLFKVSWSILGILANALVGAVVLWILNLFGLGISITWFTALIVGAFGIGGVIITLILKFIFHLF